MTHCPRYGKDNPAEIHTCTPLALKLADELTTLTGTQKAKRTTAKQAADELLRLYAENDALRDWIREQGTQTDTCTWNILREKCAYCQCHRSKK